MIKQKSDRGPLGIAVGALAGGVIGLLGGPIGAAIGIGGGAMLGMLNDVANFGVSAEFLEQVAKDLSPGKVAVIAEVAEDWVTPLDTRMSALGGVVHRTGRADVEDELARSQMAAIKAEATHLKAEYAQAKTDDKAKLKARIDAVELRIHATSDRLHARVLQNKEETEAKLTALWEQAARAEGDVKARIDTRITELRASGEHRSALLKQAWGLTKQAAA